MPSSRQPRKRLSPFQEQAQRIGQMVLLVVASLSRPVERSHGLICIRGFGSALGSGSRWLFQRSSASRLVDPGNGSPFRPRTVLPGKGSPFPNGRMVRAVARVTHPVFPTCCCVLHAPRLLKLGWLFSLTAPAMVRPASSYA